MIKLQDWQQRFPIQTLILYVLSLGCGGQPSPKRPATIADADNDRIAGTLDVCPNQPEDYDDFEDQDGCPEPDNDNDRVLDVDDLCPLQREDWDGFEDTDGCPDPDDDKDRILDQDDSCPREAEVYNGIDDDDGCPDTGKVEIYTCSFPIRINIFFRLQSKKIVPATQSLIDAIAETLVANPDIELTAVVGYAGGNESKPEILARARAQRVTDALVSLGIPREKLTIRSTGASAPYRPGSKKALPQDRRVEFHVLKRGGVQVGQWDGLTVQPIPENRSGGGFD